MASSHAPFASEPPLETVLPFADALATVLTHAAALPTPASAETLPLLQTAGRTLARPVLADRDQPPFPRSTRDGYALHAASSAQPLRVVGQVRAGQAWSGPALAPAEALEIMTGAPVPHPADAVVMVEHTTLHQGLLHIDATRSLRPGDNIVPQGAEARAGQTVLPAGRLLAAAEIAVAASCGCATLPVFGRPTVAILATGDELVELGTTPTPIQIVNSNTCALATLVTAEGGSPAPLPIAADTVTALQQRVARGSAFPLMLLSGGVSMGKFDLVEDVLTELGAEFFFTGALIQPGKPIVFGRLPGGTYFFGLPGNPVSTQVCFHLFVAPLLRALAGRTDLAPRFAEARLAHHVPGGARVTRFLPAQLTSAWDAVTVQLVGWQGSGDVSANARADAYCVLPVGPESFSAGDTVRILLR